MQLSEWDRACLSGTEGEAAALAMKILVRMGEISGAERMIDVGSAHIDGGLYHGPASLDFATRLATAGGEVRVPTTLNVSSLDLLHPHLYRGDPETAAAARRLMQHYIAMGCRQSWTCAPYQLPERPSFGQHIAWAESNAIVFANSVLGARTDRYGDFIDICAALTGRAPEAGLHRTESRAGRIVFDVGGLPEEMRAHELFYPVLGHLIGYGAGSSVPVIVGMDLGATEDDLKALGAAAASSGAVAMFHAVGVTPEAANLEEALQGHEPQRTIEVDVAMMKAAYEQLTTASGDRIDAVSIGTPHLSVAEGRALVAALRNRRVHRDVAFYASTGRDVLRTLEDEGLVEALEAAGVRLVTDTCTYITPILAPEAEVVLTNSAKWAYYAPSNLGLQVAFDSLMACVESAVAGRRVSSGDVWTR
jgi:predicted aconitase